MGKIVFKDGDGNPVDVTITGVVNQKDNSILKFWKGTQSEYNTLSSVDSNTIYIIEDAT